MFGFIFKFCGCRMASGDLHQKTFWTYKFIPKHQPRVGFCRLGSDQSHACPLNTVPVATFVSALGLSKILEVETTFAVYAVFPKIYFTKCSFITKRKLFFVLRGDQDILRGIYPLGGRGNCSPQDGNSWLVFSNRIITH